MATTFLTHLCLLATLAAVSASEDQGPGCCQTKTVGAQTYELLKSGATPHECSASCIYTSDLLGDNTRYCFAPGNLTSVCTSGSAGASSCKCGVKGARRIVGGEIAQPGEWPWIVVYSRRWQGGCGGTLVADNWVVTAAHCFYNSSGIQTDFADSMSVVIGEHTIHNTTDQYDTTLKRKNLEIEKVIIHESYNPAGNDHDIALLKLKEKLDLSVYMPACLPPAGKSWVGSTGWVYGWGKLYSGAKYISHILRETSQTIISNTACEQGSAMVNSTDPDTGVTSLVNVTYKGEITSNMLCGEKAGTDSCQGDSGGPFTVEENGQHQLAGVVSWGEGCATPGLAGVYSDVSNLRAWIDKQFAANGGTPKFCAA